MNIDQLLSAREEGLAIGVLSQAAHDLRRFHNANSGLQRELYLDAYHWIRGDDFTWPYSFVNICKLLNVPPETLRAELLADASLGWFGYWSKLGARFSRTFGASLGRAFKSPKAPLSYSVFIAASAAFLLFAIQPAATNRKLIGETGWFPEMSAGIDR